MKTLILLVTLLMSSCGKPPDNRILVEIKDGSFYLNNEIVGGIPKSDEKTLDSLMTRIRLIGTDSTEEWRDWPLEILLEPQKVNFGVALDVILGFLRQNRNGRVFFLEIDAKGDTVDHEVNCHPYTVEKPDPDLDMYRSDTPFGPIFNNAIRTNVVFEIRQLESRWLVRSVPLRPRPEPGIFAITPKEAEKPKKVPPKYVGIPAGDYGMLAAVLNFAGNRLDSLKYVGAVDYVVTQEADQPVSKTIDLMRWLNEWTKETEPDKRPPLIGIGKVVPRSEITCDWNSTRDSLAAALVSLDRVLLEAVKREDLESVSEALKQGADVNATEWEGGPFGASGINALVHAVDRRNVALVSLLLKLGCDVSFVSLNTSPVYLAVEKDEVQILKTLLEYKPDREIVDSANKKGPGEEARKLLEAYLESN